MATKTPKTPKIDKKILKSIREQKSFGGKLSAAAKGSFKNFLQQKKNVLTGGSSTKGGIALHLLGAHGAKQWYETFFGKSKMGGSSPTDRSTGGTDTGDVEDDVSQIKDEVKAIKQSLGSIKDAIDEVQNGVDEAKDAVANVAGKIDKVFVVIATQTATIKSIDVKMDSMVEAFNFVGEDVADIKSMLMPKVVTAAGKKGGAKEGQEKLAAYDPLAPAGAQFREVTSTGKLMSRGPGKEFQDSATKQAALATATLALKIAKKDQERGEMRKKNQWKDPKEVARQGNPVAELRLEMNEKFDKVFGLLEEIKGESKDSLGENMMEALGIMRLLGGLAPLAGILAKGGLVAMAGILGYKLGEWLNDTFKLDEKINNLIDSVMGFFGKGNDAKAREATKTDKFSDLQAKTNAKLEGTGYKLIAPGQYQKDDGTVYKADELSGEVQEEFGRRGLKGFEAKPVAPPAAAAAPASVEPDIRTGPSTRGGKRRTTTPSAPSAPPTGPKPIPGETGTLGKKPASATPISGEEDIKRMIMAHEGVRYKPYKDSLGLWTVGVGHLIGDGKSLPPEWDRTFSEQEIRDLFEEDYAHHRKQAEKIPGFTKLNKQGQGALTDLTFNMGPAWIKKFPSVGKALSEPVPDVQRAADILEGSKWYKQVKSRGPKIVGMMRASLDGVSAPETSKDTMYASVSPAPAATPAAGQAKSSVAPSKNIPAGAVEGESRQLQAANAPSQAAPVVVNAPTVNNTKVASNGPKPTQAKASAVSHDDSLIRMSGRDAQHPVLA